MNWRDIEDKLRERAEEVARHLMPAGHREGAEWMCGSIEGRPGRSLRVNLVGKPGVWSDFNGGSKKGGTFMSLWCEVTGQPFKVCIVAAKQFLGIPDEYFEKRVRSHAETEGRGAPAEVDKGTYRPVAETWAECAPLTEGGPVWEYLVTTRRLEPAVLAWFDVREKLSYGKWLIAFPYFAPAREEASAANLVVLEDPAQPPAAGRVGAPTWIKFEHLERLNGKKKEFTTKGPEKCLWGAQLSLLPRFTDARGVLICEGEKDAMTWASYGCFAWSLLPVSVPFGAKWRGQVPTQPSPNREWMDRCGPWLDGFETIFIAMDSDEAGRRAAADIINELGPRRCRHVQLPLKPDGSRYKDINDCLLAGVPADDIKACLDNARDFAPEKVRRAGEYEEEYLASWFDEVLEQGLKLPFGFPWRVRMGETTVWTGIEKSGKSTMLSFILMGLMAQGERCLVGSFEVRPVKTLKKYSRQAYGGLIFDHDRPPELDDPNNALYRAQATKDAREALGWLDRNLWIYHHVGIARWREVLEDFRWARHRYGITQFVLDNFMRLGMVKDDYAQQAECMAAICGLAMDLNVHIHVVVHQNKSEGQKGFSGKRSVAGAFEIIANAHNIVEVQRDAHKAALVAELWENRKAGSLNQKDFSEQLDVLQGKPDGKFILHAQRDGEEQNASRHMWFLYKSQQYVGFPPSHTEHRATRFIDQIREGNKQKANTELPARDI